MSIQKKGGFREGSGRKKLSPKVVSLKLTQDEIKVLQASENQSKLVRYLIRKHAGLCLHPVGEMEMATGAMKCRDCGADVFENFSEFIIKNPE